MAFASPAALVFVIRWLICGVALMLRRRQPTVVAQRPPSASFDATHPLISLFYFHFSRRERAATQAATSARNAPPAPKTKKEARSATASGGVCRAQAHSTRSWSFWPSPGQIKLRLCRTTVWFWVLRFACGVHRVPVRRARPRSIDVEFDQPKPAHLRPSSTLHPGGANKHRRGPQRPAGARGANETLNIRNGCFP